MIDAIMALDWWLAARAHDALIAYPVIAGVVVFLNYAFVVALIATVAVFFVRHPRVRSGWVVVAFSGALAYLVSRLIGFVFFRPRPFVTHSFEAFIAMSPLSKSFPSSHAIVSFAVAMALYARNRRWGTVALVLAGLISISRVLVGVHYPSDVLAGALLGVILSMLIQKFWKRR